MAFSMTLVLTLLVVPLACLFTLPIVRSGFHPSERLRQVLAVPWRAACVLLLVNLLILSLTVAVFLGLNRTMLPMVMGPVLSIVSWAYVGKAMPLNGTARWLAVLVGMSPYILLTAAMAVWIHSLPEPTSDNDPFMAWIGGLIGMVVGIGATTVGTLVTGLVRDRLK